MRFCSHSLPSSPWNFWRQTLPSNLLVLMHCVISCTLYTPVIIAQGAAEDRVCTCKTRFTCNVGTATCSPGSCSNHCNKQFTVHHRCWQCETSSSNQSQTKIAIATLTQDNRDILSNSDPKIFALIKDHRTLIWYSRELVRKKTTG